MITNMKVRLAITYIFNLIDLIATMYLVSLFGLSVEGNPIGRWLIRTNLVYPFKIIVMGGLLLTIGLLGKIDNKYASALSWITLVIYTLVVLYHIVIFINLWG